MTRVSSSVELQPRSRRAPHPKSKFVWLGSKGGATTRRRQHNTHPIISTPEKCCGGLRNAALCKMGIATAEQALVFSGENAKMEVSEPRTPGPHCACTRAAPPPPLPRCGAAPVVSASHSVL
eukprot:10510885-Alexandrium_andersonii.AAC.1